MNESRGSFLPLLALVGIVILLWLYLTDKINGIVFSIFATILFVFAFTKNTTFLLSATIGMSLGYGAYLVEKIIMASSMTAVLNLRAAEMIGDASQRLLSATRIGKENSVAFVSAQIDLWSHITFLFGPRILAP